MRAAMTAPPQMASRPAAVNGPRGTSIAARGSAADTSTIVRSAAASTYATRANGRAASIEAAPTATVTTLVTIRNGNSGTAMTFATGDTSEIRPKIPATIGSVGTVAARVVARPSPTIGGSPRSRAAIGDWNASRPPVAAALSRKPASPRVVGSSTSITAIAAHSPLAAAARRPSARPSAVTAAMIALRRTLAPRPTSRL